MRTITLLERNLSYFWRTNIAVVLGVTTAVAVLSGALLVGDSVRASLRDLFLERLGRCDYVVSAPHFFRDGLTEDFKKHRQFDSEFNALAPVISMEGLVIHGENGRRASGVQVYGADSRFFEFHGVDGGVPALAGRDAFVNSTLAQELSAKVGDAILVTVTKPATIPGDSLHGRKENRGLTLRLSTRFVLPAEEMGDFSTRPSQGDIRTVFLPLSLLQNELGQAGKVNTVLVTERPPRNNHRRQLLEGILKQAVQLEDLELKVRALTARHALSVESDSALLPDNAANAGRESATNLGMAASPVLTYLANSIRLGQREIPYSLVTAVDFQKYPELSRERSGDAVAAAVVPPIILSEWPARELQAQPGDAIWLEYYLWSEDGHLASESSRFQVAAVIPMRGIAADPDLTPDYPGLTDAPHLGDWDPPFPIDLKRITPRDEAYWDKYRTTPKAFIPLEEGQKLWQSRFGKLTSLRVTPPEGHDFKTEINSYRESLRAGLDPLRMGFFISEARGEGLQASRGATDFGEYFTYFSFFLVVSGLLLAALFFWLGIEQRRREIGILQSIGLPISFIRFVFLAEGAFLVVAGSILGMGAAVAYAALIMHGLRTWWVDAVGTTSLALHVSPVALAFGCTGGILAGLLSIAWTLRGLRTFTPQGLLAGSREPFDASHPASRAGIICAGACLAAATSLALAASGGAVNQSLAFFMAGALTLMSFFSIQWWWLRKGKDQVLGERGTRGVWRLGFRNAKHRPGRSVLCIALIASATFVIVAVSAFHRTDSGERFEKKSGTGGFPLLAESLLPVYFDPDSSEGRYKLNLAGRHLAWLDRLDFVPFLLKPGDDASCLNLYRPQSPRILGARSEFIRSNRFRFQESLADSAEAVENPWLLLQSPSEVGAIPAIADANSMTYVLHLKLGDVLTVAGERGAPVRLRMVGTLSDSVLQGEIIISENNFRTAFPSEGGYRFFLLDLPPQDSGEVITVIEEALSDYDFNVVSSEARLAQFHRVENTYLATFQTLGGLGLLLGTVGLAAVLLRNVLERRKELALLRAVGYRSEDLVIIVLSENVLLLGLGLVAGAASATLAIAPALYSRGVQLSATPLGFLFAVLVAGIAASIAATVAAIRSPLLPALKSE